MKNGLKQTPRIVGLVLVAFMITSPYDLFFLPLAGEVVDIPQLLLIIIGFLLLVRERRQVKLPLWGAEFLIVTGSMIAITQAADVVEALETLSKDIYMYLFFVMVVNLVAERLTMLRLVKWWQIMGVFEGALILFSLVTNVGQAPPDTGEAASELGYELEADAGTQDVHEVKRAVTQAAGIFTPGRQRGTFANANLAGLYLAQAAVLAIGMPFSRKPLIRWGSVAVMVGGLAATGSNSTLGAWLVATVVYILIASSNHWRFFWLGSGSLGLALIFGTFVIVPPDALAAELAQVSSVFEQGISRIPESVESRSAMVISGWQQYREQPLGLAPHGMRESPAERNVHNDYAAYFYERSFLGLTGLLLLLFGGLARALYSAMHGDDQHRNVMATLLGVVLVTMVTELAHEYMRERETWLALGMIVAFAQFEMQERQAKKVTKQAEAMPWALAPARTGVEAGAA